VGSGTFGLVIYDYILADKKNVEINSVDRYPSLTLTRVGIHGGHSSGGFMSTAAMLVYPGSGFKVAASSSGNTITVLSVVERKSIMA